MLSNARGRLESIVLDEGLNGRRGAIYACIKPERIVTLKYEPAKVMVSERVN